ncbi:MAG: DUF971 domain-containing protein [Elusimicrobia bacterium]|nr:DUF971 domain-containing protein [Elusimicrobiota bacterium]
MDLARAFEHEVARVNGAPLADEPKNVSIGSTGDLRIEWADGHGGINGAWGLRVSCPCAACVDEDTGKRGVGPQRIPPGHQSGGGPSRGPIRHRHRFFRQPQHRDLQI